MTSFLTYWYLKSPGWFYHNFLRSISELENSLAVRDTARHFTQPLFQDYSREGRIIGYFLRSGRILFGLFLYFAVGCLYAVIYLLWITFPILCLVGLVGSAFGPSRELLHP